MHAAQMALSEPVQGRLDVPGGAASGCWRLTVPPGMLRVVINFDQPQRIEAPSLRITDDIGRTLSKTGIGALSSGAALTHRFAAEQTIIVELSAKGGTSHFGMRAESEPDPEPADAGPAPDTGIDLDAGGPVPIDRGITPRRRDQGPRPDAERPPAPTCATYSVVRIIPSGSRAVTLTVRLPITSSDEIDWSGPIAVTDQGNTIASGRLEGRSSGQATVYVKGLTAYRAKGVAVRFACRER